MRLTEERVREFTDDDMVLARGIDYYKRGRVRSIRIMPDMITAKVRGGGTDYAVTIRIKDDLIDADCSCPYKGLACKHVVATLRQAMEIKKNAVAVEVVDEKSEIQIALEQKSKEELIGIIIELMDATEDMKDKILE